MEAKLQSKILKDLKQNRHYSIKIILGNRNGVPDILSCINGKFVAFEVKDGQKGVVTELQDYNISKIIESGGHAFVVRTFEEYKNAMQKLIK